jgi:hypothetical protein
MEPETIHFPSGENVTHEMLSVCRMIRFGGGVDGRA